MSAKEQLWYLINGLLNGSYDINTFCVEFNRIFNLEISYNELLPEEYRKFNELSVLTGRYADDSECLKYPGVYFNEEQIRQKVQNIVSILNG